MAAPVLEVATVSVPSAGRILGISRNAAYEAVKRGEIPAIKLGKRIVVPRAALDRMLNGDVLGHQVEAGNDNR